MIGAGSVVARDVPPFALMLGNPARQKGYVCRCGRRLIEDATQSAYKCPACKKSVEIGKNRPIMKGAQ
jgi:acyl-[acyl carrier protein]--UDP-N-acetylglucosamine O-acyltransferase